MSNVVEKTNLRNALNRVILLFNILIKQKEN